MNTGMNGGLSPEDLRKMQEYYENIYNIQKKAGESLGDYRRLLLDIQNIQAKILKAERDVAKLEAKETKLIDDRAKLHAKIAKTRGIAAADLDTEVQAYDKLILATKTKLEYSKSELSVHKENVKILKEAADTSTRINAGWGTGSKLLGKMLGNTIGIGKELLDQQKSVNATEKAMGILSKQSRGFRENIYGAAVQSNQLGVNTADLAKMQDQYSEQVGRSVALSKEGLVALSEMAMGTGLGIDGAAEMAANLENFNISAIGASKVMEDMMNTASKMGVNSLTVTKNLKKNLQLANKFHFKDGVKGMVRLAAETARIRVDMDGIASMADQVFRPEGAVEMAAKLQTMGGEFAKLADPFSLMFKARNDFEGFTNDIVNATKEFAKLNSKTGEFEISGLGLDRIKEISKITGISAENLAQMGRDAAKLDEIEMQVGFLSEDNKKFISSIATFNESTKEWEAVVNGQLAKSIKMFTDAELDAATKEKQNLKERAKQAQTFDETWANVKNTFKSLLLPAVNGFSEGIKEPLNDFLDWANNKKVFENLFETAKNFGMKVGDLLKWGVEFGTKFMKFVTENPITSAIGLVIGNTALWTARGVALGMGFNSVAGGGGLTDLLGGGSGGSKLGKFGKIAKIGGGLLSAGISGYNEYTTNKEAGMSTGENVGRTAIRAGSSGLGAWGGAAAGAAIGSAVPVVGTVIGGLIGGLIGGFGGDAFGDYLGDKAFDDVIIKAGQPPIGINPNDHIIAMKDNGPIDKALGARQGGSTTTNVPATTKVTFANDIRISGDITINGGRDGSININDPILLREISSMIRQELSKAIGGGKLSANPA